MTFFKQWTIENVNSLGYSIELHPTFDYSEIINTQRGEQTEETGRVDQYRLGGGSFQFNLPLNLVNSSDTTFIRNLWQNQNMITFTQRASDNGYYLDGRITNRNDPLNRYSQAQYTDFDGVLNLMTIKDYNTARGLSKKTLQASYFILGTLDGILGINALA
jgi:hypothetical protein